MIRLESVGLSLEGFRLEGIDLDIPRGEYFVILGPSGAGKTLLLEIMAGLVKPDSGRLEGTESRRIGLIYQDYMLFPHLNVFRNIAYGLNLKKADKGRIRTEVLKATELLDIRHLLHKDIGQISGGEKQRVAIARAMVMKPDLYLLDEPTAALDFNTRLQTQRLLMDLHRQGQATFVHVTHDFEEALALADRIALLFDGRIVQVDRPDTLFSHPVSKEAASFLGYKNVFSGPIVEHNLQVRGLAITTPVKDSALAYAAVRSNDIILSKSPLLSSARNSFPGTIAKLINRGSFVEVLVDIGIILHADITKSSCTEMALREGEKIWTTFKTASVKIFEHG